MAGYAHPEPLVNTEWVADHGNDPNVRLAEVDVDLGARINDMLGDWPL